MKGALYRDRGLKVTLMSTSVRVVSLGSEANPKPALICWTPNDFSVLEGEQGKEFFLGP